jgi:RNA polymerase sigma factor (sigma-70 family)
MTDSVELLRRYAADHAEADFTELVRENIDFVYAVALRQLSGDTHLAEDVTQRVFIDLARKAGSLSQRPTLTGWLYCSTQFAAAAAVRTEQRRRAREQEAHAMNEREASGRTEADWAEVRPALDRAMGALTDRERDALMLRFFENQPFAEIGLRLSLSENAARMRVERALERLRILLSRRGITSTAATLSVLLSSRPTLAAPTGLTGTVVRVALASAVGAGPILGNLLRTMTTLKTTANAAVILGLTALLGLISVGTGVYELNRTRSIAASIQAARRQSETDQTHLRSLANALQAADQSLASLQKKAEAWRAAQEAGATAPAGPSAKASLARAQADFKDFEAAYPEAHGQLFELGRLQLEQIWGRFFRLAGLTPIQIEAFETRTMDDMEDSSAMSPGRFSPMVEQLPDDQLRALLGDQAFQQFKDYARMMPANNLASGIQLSEGYLGTPLSDDQVQQIAQIVARNDPGYQAGQALNLNDVDWANAQAQTQARLSPAQWKAAEGIFLGYQYQSALALAQQTPSSDTR